MDHPEPRTREADPVSTVAGANASGVRDRHRSGWAVVEGVRGTWRRFRHDSAALPDGAWRAWWAAMGIGVVATAIVMLASVWIGRYLVGRGMQEWDENLLLRIVESNIMSFHDALYVESLGASAFLLPLAALATVIAIRVHRPLRAVSIAAAYVLHDPFVWVAWQMWNRARPDLVLDGIAAPGLNSYPSGHVVNVVATYGIFAYLWMRASASWIERAIIVLLLVLVVVIVGVARVRMGTHWPSDLIAGAAIGVTWLATVVVALRRAERIAHG